MKKTLRNALIISTFVFGMALAGCGESGQTPKKVDELYEEINALNKKHEITGRNYDYSDFSEVEMIQFFYDSFVYFLASDIFSYIFLPFFCIVLLGSICYLIRRLIF